MRQMVIRAKKTIYDRDGFVNGFIKGAAGSVAVLAALSLIAACMG